MKETSKAMRRRWSEEQNKLFPWASWFAGWGIDVGPGDDPLPLDNVTTFDQKDGDANKLSSYFVSNSFDYLHASNVLEHMHDPDAAVRDWLEIIKPGGYMIVTVPSWELYEGMVWPSRFNGDHKSTWSLWQHHSPCAKHVHVPSFVQRLDLQGYLKRCLICRLVDTNYRYDVLTSRDQTIHESDNVEAFIEIVLQKRI